MNKMQIEVNGEVLNDKGIIGSLVEILNLEDPANPDDVGFIVTKILNANEMMVCGTTGNEFKVTKHDIVKIYPADPDNEGEFIGL